MIAEGFDAEQIKSLGDYAGDTNVETLARDTADEHFGTSAGGVNSAARLVRITEHYVRMDYEGDGRPCLYQVITGGDQGEILRKDGRDCITPFDAMPFAATTPVPMTHRFFGRSIADLVMPLQREKTALKRGALDNLYLHNNPRVEVSEANAGPNTLDDLLVSRPGGVVRTKTPGGLNWQVVPDITSSIYPMMQYLDAELETRTGLEPASAGDRCQRAAEPVGDRGGAGVLGLANAHQADRADHGGGRARYLCAVARHDPQARPAAADRAAAQRLGQCRSARLEDPRRHDHQCRPRQPAARRSNSRN